MAAVYRGCSEGPKDNKLGWWRDITHIILNMHAAGLVLAAVSWYFESAQAQQSEFDIDENIDGKQGFLFPESLVSDTDSLAGHTTYRLIVKTKMPYITSIYGAYSTVDENRPAESMRRASCAFLHVLSLVVAPCCSAVW